MSALDEYYRVLDAGDVDATLACFTDDAVYVRPRLDGPGLEFVRGRDELAVFFAARGKKPYRHFVHAHAGGTGRCFVEGTAGMEGEPPTHVFLADATIEPDGRISRYFALMSEAPEDWTAT
jgi:ketosteroid isomerase-like protein